MSKVDFNDLTLENVGQWPLCIKRIFFLGVLIFILLLGYEAVLDERFTHYAHLKTKELTLKKNFENKHHQIINFTAYNQQVGTLKKQVTSSLEKFPEKSEMPGLLEEISKIGIASGLKFKLIAPQKQKVGDFYVELPVKISIIGSYFQLARFLNQIASLQRIVTLHDFTLQRDASQEPDLLNNLVMQLTIKIYWQLEQ